jgi:hypothetical protein
MTTFTQEEVIAEAKRRYGKAICIDQIDDAMQEPNFEDAVKTIIFDSAYWDSPTGNPFE